MDNVKIDGETRSVGLAQGFEPLSIRDEILDMGPRFGHVPVMMTAWKPTAAELTMLNTGEPLFLTMWGSSWPPVMLTVGYAPSNEDTAGHG